MFETFTRMLGLPFGAAEDALKSEKLAKQVLSRRGFIVGSTAVLCSGTAFGFAIPEEDFWLRVMRDYQLQTRQMAKHYGFGHSYGMSSGTLARFARWGWDTQLLREGARR